MRETLKKSSKREWNSISKTWHKKYHTIKIRILLRLISLNILTKKPTLQKCREITKFEIFSKVNPIRSMKTWSKSSCTLFMKESLEIVSQSRCRYRQLIKNRSEVYVACRHNPRFHRFTRH